MSGKQGPYNSDGSGKANDYQPPKLPDSAFPSVKVGSGFSVHLDALRRAVDNIKMEARQLGSSAQSAASGGSGAHLAGDWSTIQALSANAGSAHQGIVDFSQSVLSTYEEIIKNLMKNAQNYADAESATGTAVRGVGAPGTSGAGSMTWGSGAAR